MAGFPATKTLEDHDFGFATTAPRRQIEQLVALTVVARRENLAALVGLPGRWIDTVHDRRPPNRAVRRYTSFHCRAKSWARPRRVVARIGFHPGELFPRAGFVVSHRSLPNERILAFYNSRGTADQHIKEGKHALTWTRLSCMPFAANAVRLQLHAPAYNLANFLWTLATPTEIATRSLTSLHERPVKTGARLVRHARYAVFRMAGAALPRAVFASIIALINGLRGPPVAAASA